MRHVLKQLIPKNCIFAFNCTLLEFLSGETMDVSSKFEIVNLNASSVIHFAHKASLKVFEIIDEFRLNWFLFSPEI